MTQKLKAIDDGWIKEIPVSWDLKKVKEVYEFVSVKVSDTEYPALTVSSKYGITPQMEHVAKTLNGDSRKRVEKGDFVINSRADRPGACGISDYDGSVSMICHVLKPRNKEKLHEKYMHYLFRNNMFSQEFFRWGRGIVSDLWSTRKDEFGNLQLPIPSLSEQKIIGNYLEYKEKSINALIVLKEKQLEKLNEQRQSIIAQTVEKGLNPNVKMKDSGVEWIGEIPEHWEVKPLYSLYRENKLKNKGNVITNVLSLSYGKIKRRDVESNFGLLPDSFETYQIVQKEDIILRLTDLQNDKRSLRVGLVNEEGIITSAYLCLKRSDKSISEYIYYLLHSYDLTKVFYGLGSGVRQSMGFTEMKKLPILLPPLEEQLEIVNQLKVKVLENEQLIDMLKKQIEKLKEYRQSLIYEVVTGKIDVRDMELE